MDIEIIENAPETAAEYEEVNGPLPARPWETPRNLTKYRKAPIPMMEETGEFLLSYYGAQMALGFKGDLAFINRCFSWAENTGVIGRGAGVHWFYGVDGKLGYVCPPDKATIRKGLIAQFRTEIIQSNRVAKIRDIWSEEEGLDIEYNEEAVNQLAEQKADEFMAIRIKHDCFLATDPKNIAPIYAWSPPVSRLGSKD